MKRNTIILSSVLSAFIFGLFTCQTDILEKVEKSEIRFVGETNYSYIESEFYPVVIEDYREKAEQKISDNQESPRKNKAIKAIDGQSIHEEDMKSKLNDYKVEGKIQWTLFKTEVKKDLLTFKKTLEELADYPE
jgi:hypothetical protein